MALLGNQSVFLLIYSISIYKELLLTATFQLIFIGFSPEYCIKNSVTSNHSHLNVVNMTKLQLTIAATLRDWYSLLWVEVKKSLLNLNHKHFSFLSFLFFSIILKFLRQFCLFYFSLGHLS